MTDTVTTRTAPRYRGRNYNLRPAEFLAQTRLYWVIFVLFQADPLPSRPMT